MRIPAAFRVVSSFFLSLLVLVALLHVPLAHADTITIIPPEFELFGNPGDTINDTLKVQNGASSDVTYTTSVVDFQASGDTGGVDLIEDPKAPKTTFSLASWVSVSPHSFSVAAGAQKSINISIKVPKDAEPGGHYASIQVKLAGAPAASGSGASVQSNLNSLILLRVSGAITEKLTVDSFATSQTYYKSSPITFALKTKNEGNVHDAPSGTIVITDMFNRKVAEVPLKEANVLPGSSRLADTSWTAGNLFGRYTATLVATYGTNKTPLTSSTTFYAAQPSLLGLIVGALLIIFFFIFQRKKLKRIINRLTSD